MKKIMFNDKYCLTQAVLDGTKTMTRRILHGTLFWERCPEGMWTDDEIKAWKKEVDQRLIDYSMTDEWPQMKIFAMKHCRYKVGEVVAIAQSYNDIGKSLYDDFCNEVAGNTNKMFVKADLMKHHIRITDVKVERLQDISENECLKEGIKLSNNGRFYFHQMVAYKLSVNKYFDTPREAFAYLIDKISGKGTWESNPFVVAYSFELVD
jgi:hypothetical protein|nr:MAG TPA: ASCH domain protein [Caudoviricetes sp.]